ncbi:hypothetical protein [Nonomuraea bangladeshensis]|uniref:hypothetical protein n=1 Tax=Nonomuraea bangladeshensis TaxID=404385 RepID=UPI0031CE580C
MAAQDNPQQADREDFEEAAALRYTVAALRLLGSLGIGGGFAGAVIELVWHPDFPSLPWLAVFLVAVMAGVGLRIEAAVQDRPSR